MDHPAEEIPHEIRTITLPDGNTASFACAPGAYDHMTDEELAAMMLDGLPAHLRPSPAEGA